MELRTDLMKMTELDRFEALLEKYTQIPEFGLVFGLTDNAKASWWDHEDEDRWREMTLLFVTKVRADVIAAGDLFRAWAAAAHPDVDCYQVGVEDEALPEGSSRYWIYILR